MIQNEIIADSIGTRSPRLTTMRCMYPKFVHNEHLRHRAFSFSVSSARAIPFNKLLEEVQNDATRAEPVFWGSEQKGMSPGGELSNIEMFNDSGLTYKQFGQMLWRNAALEAAERASYLARIGTHKSICNRIIEPFIHCHVLVTGTEAGWMNYFGLRLDKAAEPTIRTLAELQWKHWNESKTTKLEPGQWHLPFVADLESCEDIRSYYDNCSGNWGGTELDLSIQISVARCARLSYNSFETNKRSTIEEDLKLYDRLIGSNPIHASPAEHQATPDNVIDCGCGKGFEGCLGARFANSKENGNFGPGWRQYRKMLPNESVAPLPEQYR